MVRGSITLKERNKALSDYEAEEKRIIKRARRNPLTLSLQSQIAGSVGRGNVNFEFKRLNRLKKRIKKEDLFSLNFSRGELLKRKIKEEPPIIPEIVLPKINLNTEINL